MPAAASQGLDELSSPAVHVAPSVGPYPQVHRTIGWARVMLRSILWPKRSRMFDMPYLRR